MKIKSFPFIAAEILPLVLILGLYAWIRLSSWETIEFGYDQPMLTDQVIKLIENPNFFNSYQYVAKNPIGFPSWGIMQLYFFVPFVLISKDPILLSLLIALFNGFSIVIIYLTGSKYSTKTAIISALVLATQPWWNIFSRMIYQPTAIMVPIILSLWLFLKVWGKPKDKLVCLLILSWAILFQLYVHTFSFILTSALALLTKIKKLNFKMAMLGLSLSLMLFLPAIKYYLQNPKEFEGFFQAQEQIVNFKPLEIKRGLSEYLQYLSGGDWNWQLGQASKDFFNSNKEFEWLIKIALIISLMSLIWGIKMILMKKHSQLLILLLVWGLGPIWFLRLMNTEKYLPRYLLIGIPFWALFLGIVWDDIGNKFQKSKNWIKNFVYLPIIFLISFWIWLNFSYYQFFNNYKYPQGMISYFSDIPAGYVVQALNWILKDAKEKQISNFIISNNSDNPYTYDLNQATKYVLDQVYNFKYKDQTKTQNYYVMQLKPVENNIKNYKEFGPYVVYRLEKVPAITSQKFEDSE